MPVFASPYSGSLPRACRGGNPVFKPWTATDFEDEILAETKKWSS